MTILSTSFCELRSKLCKSDHETDNECDNNFNFNYNLDALLHSNQTEPSLQQNYTACWRPLDCSRGQRTLLIIPYRNREPALRVSIPVLHHLLRLQKRDYCILVAEQADHNFFNKASLMNAAFSESGSLGSFNCFIFHDVDMLPEVGSLPYTCDRQPIHLSPAVSKFYYNLNYGTDFGGVVALSRAQFNHVNGYSNRFWGWGGEDDEMNMRIYASGLSRICADPMIGRFFMLEHQHDWGFDPSRKMTIGTGDPIFRELRAKYRYSRDDELGSKPNDWRKDGLSTVKYRKINMIEKDGYFHLMIDVSTTRLAKLDIKLIGANTVTKSVDYETKRLTDRPSCEFIETLGYFPQNNSALNQTFASIEDAKRGCRAANECFGISQLGQFRLHTETALLSTTFYRVVSGGNDVTTIEKSKVPIYMKQCQHQMEQLNQVLDELHLNQHEYTYAQLNMTLVADIKEQQELYVYTTFNPVQEIGTSDFVYYRGIVSVSHVTHKNPVFITSPKRINKAHCSKSN